jgi:hypothetical protein
VGVDVPKDTAYGALEEETLEAAGVVGAAVDDALDGVRDGVHHGIHGRSSGRHFLPWAVVQQLRRSPFIWPSSSAVQKLACVIMYCMKMWMEWIE